MVDRFPDTAGLVAHLLGSVNAAQRVGITTPADLTGLLPFVRVTRTGGPRDWVSDFARIAVDVLDSDYARGYALAEDIAAYLEPGKLRWGNALVDRITVDSAPQEVAPWAPGIFRFETTYTVVSRRYPVA